VSNTLRGFLIGLAEIVPGVSGGTIALIVGVYETLIQSASQVIKAFLAAAKLQRFAVAEALRQVPWGLVIPVGLGMIFGIVIGAWFLEPIIATYPIIVRATFAGMILASLWIPLRMVGALWSPRLVAVALVGGVAAFFLTGLGLINATSVDWWWIPPAAALAVCALVLPGVSGSYLLLTLGMYEPTLSAVNDRDFGYLGLFLLGALTGLALFVRVLQYVLTHYRAATLALMTGLMAGSLRALWPWQNQAREIAPPGPDVLPVALFAVAGFVVILALMWMERLVRSRR
jgi:putative membrane protein